MATRMLGMEGKRWSPNGMRRSAEVRKRRLLAKAQEAKRLRLQGLKLREIATRMGMGQRWVEKMLAMLGVRWPADRFRCGHDKRPENFRFKSRAKGQVTCRLCANERERRWWYRDRCVLAEAWRVAPRGSMSERRAG